MEARSDWVEAVELNSSRNITVRLLDSIFWVSASLWWQHRKNVGPDPKKSPELTVDF